MMMQKKGRHAEMQTQEGKKKQNKKSTTKNAELRKDQGELY